MAISIPIVSEFVDTGVKKAIKEFKQLETTSEKAQFAIKKAAVPAAAAMSALAVAMGDAVKAAIEDEQAQAMLARQLRASTGATDAQVKAVEDYISKQGKLTGITDDELRPAIAGLVRVTKDTTEAQKAASLAMDIAAGKGISLQTATNALEKAYGGNFKALGMLAPEVRQMIQDGASLEEVFAELQGSFGGAANEASNTAAGGFKKLKTSLNETKESIGAALLPVIEQVLPYLQKIADWAQENPGAFKTIAIAITGISVAIWAVNLAMYANPFTLIAVAIAAIITAVVIAYTKFEGFRNVVKNVVNAAIGYFEFMGNAWIKTANLIIRGMNLINPFKDIPYIPELKLGRMGDNGGTQSTKAAIEAGDMAAASSAAASNAGLDLGGGSTRAAAGGSTAPKVVAVVPKGPDGDVGPMGLPEIGFQNLSLSQIDPSIGGTAGVNQQVNINVNGGDPNAVVDALRAYMRQNGSVPIRVSPIG